VQWLVKQNPSLLQTQCLIRQTPLHITIEANQRSVVKWMVEEDRSLLDIKDAHGYTPYEYAKWLSKDEDTPVNLSLSIYSLPLYYERIFDKIASAFKKDTEEDET
jgi:hypothetical protein